MSKIQNLVDITVDCSAVVVQRILGGVEVALQLALKSIPAVQYLLVSQPVRPTFVDVIA